MSTNMTKSEIEARKSDFIEGIGTKEIAENDSIWSLNNLKKLTPEEIVDRIEQIDNQAFLYTCRLLWELRDRFPSDILFGQYIEKIKNHPTHPVRLGKQPRINKMLHVGRFCNQYKISDISKTGILQSVIVELARPANINIAGQVLHEIRRKSLPFKEVMSIIDAKQAVYTIDKQEKKKQKLLEKGLSEEEVEAELVRHRKYTVAVEDNVIEGTLLDEVDDTSSLTDDEVIELLVEPIEHTRRYELLRELADLDATNLTPEQQADELLLLSESYKLSSIKLIPVFQICIKKLQELMWKKK